MTKELVEAAFGILSLQEHPDKQSPRDLDAQNAKFQEFMEKKRALQTRLAGFSVRMRRELAATSDDSGPVEPLADVSGEVVNV